VEAGCSLLCSQELSLPVCSFLIILCLSDIKQDIKLLETLLMGLLVPLNTEKGRIIIMEVLHQVYFAPIKSYLIFLLRSVIREAHAILSINNCVYSLKMFMLHAGF
jgi:hypothetical protein